MNNAGYFREKAEHCRSMAKVAGNPELMLQLLEFASEFDEEAVRFELAASGSKPPGPGTPPKVS
jgi:hypothetical protein